MMTIFLAYYGYQYLIKMLVFDSLILKCFFLCYGKQIIMRIHYWNKIIFMNKIYTWRDVNVTCRQYENSFQTKHICDANKAFIKLSKYIYKLMAIIKTGFHNNKFNNNILIFNFIHKNVFHEKTIKKIMKCCLIRI